MALRSDHRGSRCRHGRCTHSPSPGLTLYNLVVCCARRQWTTPRKDQDTDKERERKRESWCQSCLSVLLLLLYLCSSTSFVLSREVCHESVSTYLPLYSQRQKSKGKKRRERARDNARVRQIHENEGKLKSDVSKNRAGNQKVTSSIPGRVKYVVSLVKALHPTCLGGNVLVLTVSRSG